jgi:hypothetical protein
MGKGLWIFSGDVENSSGIAYKEVGNGVVGLSYSLPALNRALDVLWTCNGRLAGLGLAPTADLRLAQSTAHQACATYRRAVTDIIDGSKANWDDGLMTQGQMLLIDADALLESVSSNWQGSLNATPGLPATPSSAAASVGGSTGSQNSGAPGGYNGAGCPKNQWVNGYYRSDGTYVSGYWRNSPSDSCDSSP